MAFFRYIDKVEKHNSIDPKDTKVAIVFACTILESLLEELLWELIRNKEICIETGEILLDVFQGRNKRIELFNKLKALKSMRY